LKCEPFLCVRLHTTHSFGPIVFSACDVFQIMRATCHRTTLCLSPSMSPSSSPPSLHIHRKSPTCLLALANTTHPYPPTHRNFFKVSTPLFLLPQSDPAQRCLNHHHHPCRFRRGNWQLFPPSCRRRGRPPAQPGAGIPRPPDELAPLPPQV